MVSIYLRVEVSVTGIKRDSNNASSTNARRLLLIFAALSVVAGAGLTVWGWAKGNQLSAIVGVLLLVDAGIVAWVVGRLR